ncbi:MAG: hypothetical protein WCX28_06990 [Bacteriovoracaceae bacterium]|nr:hypothetical protein [Bacteroidota bacterium]
MAQQEVNFLARSLNVRTKKKKIEPFIYHHRGMLTCIGSNRALADLSQVKGR